MSTFSNNVKINCSIDELISDIRSTKDPIRKIILQRFLDIKLEQMRKREEDPSLDGLSEESEEEIKQPRVKKSMGSSELNEILKNQQSSLDKLEQISKIKAYQELLAENKEEEDQELLHATRGKSEGRWGSSYDPRYSKYMKEDVMNNRMMERLNSEIDFRLAEGNKMQIEKPFDDTGKTDTTDQFARFENDSKGSKRRYVPKKNRGLGERRSLY